MTTPARAPPRPGRFMSLLLQIQDDGTLSTLGTIAKGERGTAQTVAALWAVVKESAQASSVRTLAQKIQYPSTLYAWLRAHQVYAPDPRGKEVIRTPEMLLRQVSRGGIGGKFRGDCDDVAALGCAILAAMGYRPVVSTVGATPRELGGRYIHIFFGYAAPTAGGVVLMDPQEGFPPGGLPTFPLARLWWADGEHAATP